MSERTEDTPPRRLVSYPEAMDPAQRPEDEAEPADGHRLVARPQVEPDVRRFGPPEVSVPHLPRPERPLPGPWRPLPEDHGTPGPDGPGRPGTVSIDIDAFTRMVEAMDEARDIIAANALELRTILSDADCDTLHARAWDSVVDWIESELPMLRRRLSLARELELGPRLMPPIVRPTLPVNEV